MPTQYLPALLERLGPDHILTQRVHLWAEDRHGTFHVMHPNARYDVRGLCYLQRSERSGHRHELTVGQVPARKQCTVCWETLSTPNGLAIETHPMYGTALTLDRIAKADESGKVIRRLKKGSPLNPDRLYEAWAQHERFLLAAREHKKITALSEAETHLLDELVGESQTDHQCLRDALQGDAHQQAVLRRITPKLHAAIDKGFTYDLQGDQLMTWRQDLSGLRWGQDPLGVRVLLAWGAREKDHSTWAVVPDVVAGYLQMLAAQKKGSRLRTRTCMPAPSPEKTEIIIGLWEPDAYGPMANVEHVATLAQYL